MKKLICFLLTTGLIGTTAAQPEGNAVQNSGKSNNVSLGVSFPIGRFADTHGWGISTNYSWSNKRFGMGGRAFIWCGFKILMPPFRDA